MADGSYTRVTDTVGHLQLYHMTKIKQWMTDWPNDLVKFNWLNNLTQAKLNIRLMHSLGLQQDQTGPHPQDTHHLQKENKKAGYLIRASSKQGIHRECTEALIMTEALTTLVLLEFLRWLCRSLVAPSWNVFGKAPSNMVNSGVFNSNREISTICAA